MGAKVLYIQGHVECGKEMKGYDGLRSLACKRRGWSFTVSANHVTFPLRCAFKGNK